MKINHTDGTSTDTDKLSDLDALIVEKTEEYHNFLKAHNIDNIVIAYGSKSSLAKMSCIENIDFAKTTTLFATLRVLNVFLAQNSAGMKIKLESVEGEEWKHE